jgi:membrane dipeptidase
MSGSERGAEAVHQSSIVIDTHCDTLGRVVEGQRRLGERSALGQFDLPRARDGGVTATLMATFFNDGRAGSGAKQTLDFIDAFHEELDANADVAVQAVSAADIERAKREGRVALMLTMEGAEGLEGDLGVLRLCYRLGLRVLGFTWNRRNEAADGLDDRGTGGGLTRFGRALLAECERLGVLVDIAHLSPAAVRDVFEFSERPVLATHANARAVYDHPRNLSDDQLERVAATGGVVGVVPVPPFLGPYEERAPLAPLFDHLDHLLRVVGDDHVGLGLDFDGVGSKRVEGIEDATMVPNLTAGMVERGYPPERIAKILGGNFLRVFREAL